MKPLSERIAEAHKEMEAAHGSYQLYFHDLVQLLDDTGLHTEGAFKAILDAYDLGFARGRRYEKNRKKK